MKISEPIEYSMKNIFLQKMRNAESEVKRLVPDIFCFYKALYKFKANGLPLSFNIF